MYTVVDLPELQIKLSKRSTMQGLWSGALGPLSGG